MIRRSSFSELPNVLIVHLQRILFNYDTFVDEKINSRLEFPKQLNMKPYCTETLNSEAIKEGEEIEADDRVYEKDDDYYTYELVGVVIHLGIAQAGHYYSHINVKRNGDSTTNKMDYDPSNESDVRKWLTFNDSTVTSFNLKNLEDDCFGGVSGDKKDNNADDDVTNLWANNKKANDYENSKNAYMLVYERIRKNPLQMVIQSPETIEEMRKEKEIVKFNSQDKYKVLKQYDLFCNSKDVALDCEDTAISRRDIYSKIFYDEDKNEYIYYKPFYQITRSIPENILEEVTIDNINFLNDQKIYSSHFSDFLEKLLISVNGQIKAKLLKIDLIKTIYQCTSSYVLEFLSKSNFKEVL